MMTRSSSHQVIILLNRLLFFNFPRYCCNPLVWCSPLKTCSTTSGSPGWESAHTLWPLIFLFTAWTRFWRRNRTSENQTFLFGLFTCGWYLTSTRLQRNNKVSSTGPYFHELTSGARRSLLALFAVVAAAWWRLTGSGQEGEKGCWMQHLPTHLLNFATSWFLAVVAPVLHVPPYTTAEVVDNDVTVMWACSVRDRPHEFSSDRPRSRNQIHYLSDLSPH